MHVGQRISPAGQNPRIVCHSPPNAPFTNGKAEAEAVAVSGVQDSNIRSHDPDPELDYIRATSRARAAAQWLAATGTFKGKDKEEAGSRR
jgi:hypothetical protein